MASLRRIASLDFTAHPSSNPGKHNYSLFRHSSLPSNLSLCQPELSMRALLRQPSLHTVSCCTISPYSMDFPPLPSFSPSSKLIELPLCAAPPCHSFDHEPADFSHYDTRNCSVQRRPATSVLRRPATAACSQRSSHVARAASRKVSIGLAQSLDLEESVVYSELKESMWRFEKPPRFLMPCKFEGKPCGTHTDAYPHIHTHTHDEATLPFDNKKDKTLDSSFTVLKSSGDDVKGTPMSLRMLKRKLSKTTPQAAASNKSCKLAESDASLQAVSKCHDKSQILGDVGDSVSSCDLSSTRIVGDSVSSAFACLVYMMRMLQKYTYSLSMRIHASTDESGHETASLSHAYADMLDSFLWLFQQVFSCTPRLMLLTMILLADFTLHSMSRHVAFPMMPLREPLTATISPFNVGKSIFMEGAATDVPEDMDFATSRSYGRSEEKRVRKIRISPSKHGELELLHDEHEGGDGNEGGGHPSQSKDDTYGGITFSSSTPLYSSEPLHHVHEKLDHYTRINKGTDLDLMTKHMLVAPVRPPTLEADDYPCFDRTHLAYQNEISMDPSNPLLLANYAHFLHVVRHDHARAEELYTRAVRAETDVDGEVMGRFASFLWVAKGDVAKADRAFQAAVTVDPTNAFHAGSYANFLWNLSANQVEETSHCVVDNDNDNESNDGINITY